MQIQRLYGWKHAIIYCVLFSTCSFTVRAENPLAPPPFPPAAEQTLKRWKERIAGANSASKVLSVLKQYQSLEKKGAFTPNARLRIHKELLSTLKNNKNPSMKEVAEKVFKLSDKTNQVLQVMVLKWMASSRFPAKKSEKVVWYREMVNSSSRVQQRWAVHLLADSKWTEAIDALIAELKLAFQAKKPDPLLIHLIQADLYRVLGPVAKSISVETIEKNWEKMGKKVPKNVDYEPKKHSGLTSSFFGDAISPHAVFLIDTSSSMRQQTSLKSTVKRGGTSVKKEETNPKKDKKVEIVRRELYAAVESLRPGNLFNIFSYNTNILPWANGKPFKLRKVSERTLKNALKWITDLKTETGTNIYDSTEIALQIKDVDTIYLLSDGQPSVSGKQPDILRMAEELNYLMGYRIITYGFKPEGAGSYDEKFMIDLAKRAWGWYRRLNQ